MTGTCMPVFMSTTVGEKVQVEVGGNKREADDNHEWVVFKVSTT
jgi:hypothetical protein